ncbi:unnamed protein product [Sphagnum jensenii]|uniref:Tetratricopeptide repeat protein 29 n=1 Tax=Sphagnum jensenii TaxID=128206 RepID=A0ABP1AGT9_9BRYO
MADTIPLNLPKMKKRLEQATTKANPGLTDLKVPVWQQLAVQMLVNGHPKAFIELFELTHQLQPPPPSPDYVDPLSLIGEKQLTDPESLYPLAQHLEDAEMGERTGDHKKVYDAYVMIGRLFEDIKDFTQAMFYLMRGLAAADKSGEKAYVAEVNFYLGRVAWKLLDSAESIKRYELFIAIAKGLGDEEGIIQAAGNLLEAMKSAIVAKNKVGEGEAKYQLGKLHSHLHHPDIALSYQTDYLNFCCSVNDQVGEGKAHAAMAEVYELIGKHEDAIGHMESYLKVAEDTNLTTKRSIRLTSHIYLSTQAKAACKIGMLYQRHGDVQLAKKHFENFFEMARKLKDVKMQAVARINIGVVCSMAKVNAKPTSPKSK